MKRSLSTAVLAIAAAALASACDSRAKASGGDSPKPDRLSRELESCGTTLHCAEELRCFDHACARVDRSNMGDYLAARGARAMSSGHPDNAILDYAGAVAAYETEKLDVPIDVSCAYGHALLGARAQKDKAELAARVLHKCVIDTPKAARLHRDALAALTELEANGLDGRQIGKPEPSDLYLTKAPSKPPTDKLAVTVTPNPAPRGRSFPLVPERLTQPDLRAPLVACWEQHYDQAESAKEMIAHVALKVSYRASDYDDEPGSYNIALTAPAEPGAQGAANACAKTAIEAAVTVLRLRDAIDTTLNITVK